MKSNQMERQCLQSSLMQNFCQLMVRWAAISAQAFRCSICNRNQVEAMTHTCGLQGPLPGFGLQTPVLWARLTNSPVNLGLGPAHSGPH